MQILRSKIRPPAPPAGIIDRPRLLDRILDRDRNLVLLVAPAGYGKSVLAVQVHREDPKRTGWLYLEPEDTDPRRFCRYLAGALAEVVPDIDRTELPAATASPSFEPGAWIEDLVLFLQELAPSRLRLVLDNFESVAGDPAVVGVVETLLRRGERRLDLLITSRVPPGIRLARRRAKGGALVLEAADLAFSLDEFKAASVARGVIGAEDEIAARWSSSAGWCVVLALGPGAGGTDADYLEEEILSRIPEAVAAILGDASLLDVIGDEGLAALGHGDVRAVDLASVLTAHGVPHFRIEGDGGVRLHPLVRDRLLDRFHRRGGPPAADGAAARVVDWHRSQGRPEDAVRLLLRLEAYTEALEVITEGWAVLEERDLLPQVDTWLRLLPGSMETHPLALAARIRHLRFSGRNRELAAAVARAREAGALDDETPLAPQIWSAEVWAGTHLAEGPEYDVLRERWRAVQKQADAMSRLGAQYALAVAALYQLRFAEAMEHMDTAETLITGDSVSQRAYAANAKAVILHETGHSDRALALFEEGIAVCRRQGEVSSLTINLIGKANLMKDVGRFHDAVATADEAMQTARDAGANRLTLLPHAERIRGEAYWHLGRPEEAMDALEAAYANFQDHNRYEALATGVLIDHWKRLSGTPSALVADADFDAVGRVCEAHVRHLIRRGRERGEAGEFPEAAAAVAEARELGRDMPFWTRGRPGRAGRGPAGGAPHPGGPGPPRLRTGRSRPQRLDRGGGGGAGREPGAGPLHGDRGARRGPRSRLPGTAGG
jgi:ATP/maltotriose-dependent transcriptional regulator MalT